MIYTPLYSVASHDLADVENYENIEIELAQADSLFGTVKDKNGNPVKDAEIKITLLYAGTRFNQYHPVSCVIPEMTFHSDENGEFTVTPVPYDSKVRLEITAPDMRWSSENRIPRVPMAGRMYWFPMDESRAR